jgi:hypothetical protein
MFTDDSVQCIDPKLEYTEAKKRGPVSSMVTDVRLSHLSQLAVELHLQYMNWQN